MVWRADGAFPDFSPSPTMTRRLRTGLYEELLTAALEAKLGELKDEGWWINTGKADSTVRSELLARHIYRHLRRKLDGIEVSEQLSLVNRLLDLLRGGDVDTRDRIADAEALLLEVARPDPLAGEPCPTSRPIHSLRQTSLLVNGGRDTQIAGEVNREIPSADRIDLLCAFVRHSGLRLFQSELADRVKAGAELRVITSVYTGSTERRALDTLVGLGARVKVSYEVARTRLHAKAWLFHRNSGLHTAYIGSSNLTHWAQVDGLEWNVRVSAVENPAVIERFNATFEQYWQEPEFEDYSAEPDDREQLQDALDSQRGGGGQAGAAHSLLVDVSPKPHQESALEALEAERLRGHCRNLVVAATGTGKTWIAAFDFKRLRDQGVGRSLLFVAHRDEILRQSQQVFQLVLREPGFGERLVGGERPRAGRHVFASVQSLANRIDMMGATDFESARLTGERAAGESPAERKG